MKSYMKDHRREVETWECSDKFVIEKGVWGDEVLKHMPRSFMKCEPIIIGKDADGLVVEWCYNKVIITLVRASTVDMVFGTITVYSVYKIEEIVPKEEMKNDSN